MESLACVRAVNPSGRDSSSWWLGLVPHVPDLVNRQELVRDLMAALSGQSVRAGSKSSRRLRASLGKRRRDQVTPKC